MLVRRRNPERDRAGAIDSLIITLGLALLSWIALIAPSLHDEALSTVGQARLDRLPDRRHPAAGRRDPARRRLGHAPARVLPARREHRRAARHRLRLRPRHARRRLRRPGLARRRLDQLLPAVGRRRAAPVDARPRAGRARPRAAADAAAARDAHLRLADRAGHRALLQVVDGDVDLFVVIVGRPIILFGLVVDAHGRPRAPAGALRRARAHPQRRGRRRWSPPRAARHLRAALAAVRALPATRSRRALCLADGDRVVVADAELAAWPAAVTAAALLAAPRRPVAALLASALASPRPARARARSCCALRPRRAHGLLASPATAIPGRCERARRAGHRGVARARERGADRGGPSPRERGALRLARPALERPHHRPRRRRRWSSTRARRSSACWATRPTSSSAPASSGSCSPARRAACRTSWPTRGARRRRDRGARVHAAPQRRRRPPVRGAATPTCSTTRTSTASCSTAATCSERKAFEEQLAHQAFHDPVTNLANRALFVERVRHAVARARREGDGSP